MAGGAVMRSNEQIILDIAQKHVQKAYLDGHDRGWRVGFMWGATIMGVVWAGTCIVVAVLP